VREPKIKMIVTLVYSAFRLRGLSSCKIVVAIGSVGPTLPLEPGNPAHLCCGDLVLGSSAPGTKGANGLSWALPVQELLKTQR